MDQNLQSLITIISAVVAISSALFAWLTVRTAEKTYSVELIGQLYLAYHSQEMLRDLKIIWKMYRELWKKELGSPSKEDLDEKVNNGVPIPMELAIEYFKNLGLNTKEYKAIHNIVNFWTYLTLLLKRKVISVKEITSFTSPRILGILYPMEKAYQVRFQSEKDKKSKFKQSDKNIVLLETFNIINASKYW